MSTAPKVSLDPAWNDIAPAVDVSAKDLLKVSDVLELPPAFSVRRVLIPFFCNLRRRIFFCWSTSCALLRVAVTDVTAFVGVPLRVNAVAVGAGEAATVNSSNAPAAPEGIATTSPTLSSFKKSVWKPLRTALLPLLETSPVRFTFAVRSISALKSASPPSGSFINVCLTELKSFDTIDRTCRWSSSSASSEFTIKLSASGEELAFSFSPIVNSPTIDVRTSLSVPEELCTKPYAPEFTPVTLAPCTTPV